MKKLLGALALTLAVAACGGHSTKLSSSEKAQAQRAETQLATCLERNHSVKAIKACVVPPGHSAQFTVCAAKAVGGVLLPGGKRRAADKLAACAEKNR